MMKRRKLDTADEAVKKFFRSLRLGLEGIELELEGKVIGKIIPANQLSPAEAKAMLERRMAMIREAQERQAHLEDMDATSLDALKRRLHEAIEKIPRMSETEKAALIARGRELVRQAQARIKGVPARVIEREVREAVETVRRRNR